MLSTEELSRYHRHFNLPDFGKESQERLKSAHVLVVGAGGLGCPLLLYLCAAGVGHIGIIDMDVVDLSNLQRQVLYGTENIGDSKTTISAEKLKRLNPHVKITTYAEALTDKNAIELISQYDIVADGTDNFPTRYLVNDACVLTGKINVYASIFRFEGQVSVFNFPNQTGSRGPNYRDLFPSPPPPGLVPDCASGGVLGVLPGIIGSMQALEVIKLITGIGTPLVGKLLLYDALEATIRIMKFNPQSSTKINTLINYEEFCGVNTSKSGSMFSIKEISVHKLKEWRDSGKEFQLIDVRAQNEWDFVNIAGDLIPLRILFDEIDKIDRNKDVVVLCRTGKRSASAINALQKKGFDNLYNLKGGIKAWAQLIDTNLPTY